MEALSAVIIIGGWLFYQLLRDLLKVYLDSHYPVFSYDDIKSAEKDRDEEWEKSKKTRNLVDEYTEEHKKEIYSVKYRKDWPKEYIELQRKANEASYTHKHEQDVLFAMKQANYLVCSGKKGIAEAANEISQISWDWITTSISKRKEFDKWLKIKFH